LASHCFREPIPSIVVFKWEGKKSGYDQKDAKFECVNSHSRDCHSFIHGVSYHCLHFILHSFTHFDRVISRTRETGATTTLMGRRRPLPEINSTVASKRSRAERAAINTPLQGKC
jgi:hypothetical protein